MLGLQKVYYSQYSSPVKLYDNGLSLIRRQREERKRDRFRGRGGGGVEWIGLGDLPACPCHVMEEWHQWPARKA